MQPKITESGFVLKINERFFCFISILQPEITSKSLIRAQSACF
jgi:hypothetical protein